MDARFPTLLALLGALALPAPAQAPRAGGAQATSGDRFVAGGSVRRTEEVPGDLLGAAGDLQLDAAVGGDALLVGGELRIGGRLAQNLYAAGGRVTLVGEVASNARLAGGQVEIAAPAKLDGNLTVAGGEVAVRGAVRGYVQAAGGRLLIDGPVGGDVDSAAGLVELGPNARIGGRLRYRSGEALRRDPGAQVAGGIEHTGTLPGASAEHQGATARGDGGGWIWTAGLIAMAALIAATMPAAAVRIAAELRARPWVALLVGFVALVCIPAAVIVALLTVIGIPIALVGLLFYCALLLVGYVSTATTAGGWVLERYRPGAWAHAGWRVGAVAAAMLLLALGGRIPYLGGFVVLAAMLFGMGAILMALRRPKAVA